MIGNKHKMSDPADTPSNSILELKLDYIKKDIEIIKSDVKEIKSDFISRREFENQTKDSDEKYQAQFATVLEKVTLLNRVLYWTVGALASAVVVSLIKLVIK